MKRPTKVFLNVFLGLTSLILVTAIIMAYNVSLLQAKKDVVDNNGCYLLGDVNNDHYLDQFDGYCISNYLLAKDTSECTKLLSCGDLDGDGAITPLDLIALNNLTRIDLTPRTTGIIENGKNVYYVSEDGENSLACGTEDVPCENINYANHIAVPPAIVYVKPGTYYNKNDKTLDFFVSMQDGVDLICTETQRCIIYGPIYPSSNAILDGFSLFPVQGQNFDISTNEIFAGLSRYNAPSSHNLLYPDKLDNYSRPIENLIIRNNFVKDGQFRIAESKNVLLENNKNTIEKKIKSQFWGVQFFWQNDGITLRNNEFESGRNLNHIKGNDLQRPTRPSAILIQNSKNVLIEDNLLTINPGEKKTILSYVYILKNRPDPPNSYIDEDSLDRIAASGEEIYKNANIVMRNNTISGDYIKELKNYDLEYCGNNICEEDEVYNKTSLFEYNCPLDCCGNNSCDSGEINSSQAKKGDEGYICDNDC